MAERTQIKQFLISADQTGNIIELSRSDEEVICLVFDTKANAFANLHVLISDIRNVDLFERRAQRLRSLRHVNLAPLLDAGSDDGSWYYVTPHVDGETLGKYLGRVTQVPVPVAAVISQAVIESMLAFRDSPDLLSSPSLDAFYVHADSDDTVRVTLTEYLVHAEPHPDRDPLHLQRNKFEQRRAAFNELILSRMTGKKSRLLTTRVESSFFGMALRDIVHCNPSTFLPELAQLRNELEMAIKACSPVTFGNKTRPARSLASLLPEPPLVKEVLEADERLSITPSNKGNYTHEGEDRRSHTHFKVQLLPPATLAAPEVIQRVRRVSSHLNSRDHANVLRVLNLWQTGEGWSLSETVADGTSLAQLLQTKGRFSSVETLGLLDGIDRALNQLEKAGIQCRHVRLEDLFAQSSGSEANFNVQLRAHPTAESLVIYPQESLGAMNQVIASPDLSDEASSSASVIYLCGRLLGILRAGENSVHQSHGLPPLALRFYEDTLVKCKRGTPPHRVDFLDEFRRLIQAATPKLASMTIAEPAPSVAREPVTASAVATAYGPPLLVPSIASSPRQHSPPPRRYSEEDEAPRGLAEALFKNMEPEETSPLAHNFDSPPPNADSSTWTSVDPRYFQKSGGLPLLVKIFLLLLLSGLTALALAHLSQRAPWIPKITPQELGKTKRPAATPVDKPIEKPVVKQTPSGPNVTKAPGNADKPQFIALPADEPVLEPSRAQLAAPEASMEAFEPPSRKASPPSGPALAVPVPEPAISEPKRDAPLELAPTERTTRPEATPAAPVVRPTETPALNPLPPPAVKPPPVTVPSVTPAPVTPATPPPSPVPSRLPTNPNLPDELPEDDTPAPTAAPNRSIPTRPSPGIPVVTPAPAPVPAPRAVPIPEEETTPAPAPLESTPVPTRALPLPDPTPTARPVPEAEPPDETVKEPVIEPAVPVPPTVITPAAPPKAIPIPE